MRSKEAIASKMLLEFSEVRATVFFNTPEEITIRFQLGARPDHYDGGWFFNSTTDLLLKDKGQTGEELEQQFLDLFKKPDFRSSGRDIQIMMDNRPEFGTREIAVAAKVKQGYQDCFEEWALPISEWLRNKEYLQAVQDRYQLEIQSHEDYDWLKANQFTEGRQLYNTQGENLGEIDSIHQNVLDPRYYCPVVFVGWKAYKVSQLQQGFYTGENLKKLRVEEILSPGDRFQLQINEPGAFEKPRTIRGEVVSIASYQYLHYRDLNTGKITFCYLEAILDTRNSIRMIAEQPTL
jgi:hypothetical protein